MHPPTRVLAGALTGIALPLGGLAVPASPAAAAPMSPGVITRAEYRKIHRGMTGTRVARLAGAHGRLVGGCNALGWVRVRYGAPKGRHVVIKYRVHNNGQWNYTYLVRSKAWHRWDD